MSSMKMCLERMCDTNSWLCLTFMDGSSIIGRLLRVGYDHLEIESYGDKMADYAKYLVPLGGIRHIATESSRFAEAERKRLKYIVEQGAELG